MPRPQRVEGIGVEPGRVAKLERGASALGKQVDERAEDVGILLEVRRQLEGSVASRGPSVRAVRQKDCRASSTCRSLESWVIRRGAFSVNVNVSGVAAAQPANSFSFGIR
jgi:hypothetical protein